MHVTSSSNIIGRSWHSYICSWKYRRRCPFHRDMSKLIIERFLRGNDRCTIQRQLYVFIALLGVSRLRDSADPQVLVIDAQYKFSTAKWARLPLSLSFRCCSLDGHTHLRVCMWSQSRRRLTCSSSRGREEERGRERERSLLKIKEKVLQDNNIAQQTRNHQNGWWTTGQT